MSKKEEKTSNDPSSNKRAESDEFSSKEHENESMELPSDSLSKRHKSHQNVQYILLEESDDGETIVSTEVDKTSQVNDDVSQIEKKDLPKSQSFADKLPKMKEKRKKKLNRRLATILTFFGLTALGLIYYVSPFSKLGHIKIIGAEHVSDDQIVETSGYDFKKSMWSQYFTDQPERLIIKNNPRISKVTKSLSGINEITLHIKEQQEVAYEKRADGYYPIFKDGRVANETTSDPDQHYPILIDFTDKKYVKKMMKNYEGFTEDVKENIKEIYYTPSDANQYRVHLLMHDGNEIIGSMTDLKDKINYYPQVAQQMDEMGIVDMEAGIYSYSFETRDTYEKQKEKMQEARERGDADLDLEGSEEIDFDEILKFDPNDDQTENEIDEENQ